MANIFRVGYAAPKRKSLPAGYYRLDYIEGTGTQWIDTGVSVSPTNAPKLKSVVDKLISTTGAYALDGTGYGASPYTNSFYIGTDASGNIAYGNGRVDATTTTAYDGTRRVFTYDAPNGTLSVADLFSLSFAFQTPDAALNFLLFGYNQGTNGVVCYSGKIYAAQLYLDGVEVRNFIPCFSETEGIGMYDKVNGVFYGNDGTGDFVGGNLVEEGSSTAIISVTAPTGSTVTATHSDGTVATATEVSGTWTFKVKKFGTWTVSATKNGETDSEAVSVTASTVYSVGLSFSITVQITGNGTYTGGMSPLSRAYVTIGYETYKSAATIELAPGTSINLTAVGMISNDPATIVVNGVTVASGTGNVSYTIAPMSDCTIALSATNAYYGMVTVTYATTATQALALENDGMAAALNAMNVETGGQTTAETMDELQAENTALKASLNELGVETEEQNAE